MTSMQTLPASKCIHQKWKMDLITHFMLILFTVVFAAKTINGQHRFLRYAPMVERMIKQQADRSIESEFNEIIHSDWNQMKVK